MRRRIAVCAGAQEIVLKVHHVTQMKRVVERSDPDELHSKLIRSMVNGVVIVYENSHRIDKLFIREKSNVRAIDVANHLLVKLKCNTFDSYVGI